MALSKELAAINEEIKKLAKSLGEKPQLFKEGDIKNARRVLKQMKEDVWDLNSSLSYLSQAFKRNVNELSKQNEYLTDAKKSLRSLSDLALGLNNTQEKKKLLDKNELDKFKSKLNLQKQILRRSKDGVKNQKGFNKVFKESLDSVKEMESVLRDIEDAGQDTGVKLFGALEALTGAIPGVKKIAPAFSEASSAAAGVAFANQRNEKFLKEALKTGKGLTKERIKELGLADKLKGKNGEILAGTSAVARIRKLGLQGSIKQQSALAAGFKALGPAIAKTFSFSIITKSFLEFNKVNREVRQITGQTAKNFSTINSSLVTTIDQVKTIASLSKTLGINVNAAFGKDTILASTELTELLGLSADEAAQLALRSEAFGQNLQDVDDLTASTVSNFNRNNKTAVNFQDVLKDTANASGMLSVSLGKNPESLAAAATAARALGLNLKDVEQISNSLLNFQSSIEAELEAELLTGQQINLERARSAALMNDMKTLSEEIGNNEAVINSFSTGNRIQQQAIAKAMGVSTDQMAKMYYQHQINKGLSVEQAALAANINVEEAKRLAVQDQMAKSLEKIGSAFAPILEMVAMLADNTAFVYTTLGLIGTIKMAGLIQSLASVASKLSISAASAIATNSALTFGLGALAAGAAIGYLVLQQRKAAKQMQTEDDMIMPAGYGNRVLSTPEGSIALNNNDTIVAGTNLFPKANDLLSPPSGEMTRAPENAFALDTPQKSDTPQSSPSANINLAETNALLKQLISAVNASGNTVIEIDGNKLGKVIKQNEVSLG